MKVQLTTRQRKIIKEIIKNQLEALQAILDNDCGEDEDVTLFCLENEIEEKALTNLIKRNIEEFEWVYKHPEHMLDLREIHLSTIKHLCITIPFKDRQKKALNQVWRKIMVFDQLQFNLN